MTCRRSTRPSYEDEQARTCPNCGTIHPGKEPPEGWVPS